MSLLRRIGFAAFFALVLLVGQQAVVLHDLKHATEQRDGGVPSEKGCDTHYLYAQLGSAVDVAPPVVPLADASSQTLAAYFLEGVSQRTRLGYRSQAPPQATPA
jgi:hypothetical protein